MSTIKQPTDSRTGPETITFGRTLVDGVPVDDGVTLAADSPILELLAGASTPLVSNPALGEYAAALVRPDEVDGAYLRGLMIMPPGAAGPAKHYHVDYEERFEVVEGEFGFELGDERRTVRAGESVTVEAGTPHRFGNESDSYAAFVVEVTPPSQLEAIIQFLFGLAHDGKIKPSGRPGFLQAMVMAEELGDDTVFVSPPPVVQRVLAKVFGPIGRLLGYRSMYPQYAEDSFWKEHVEQLPGT